MYLPVIFGEPKSKGESEKNHVTHIAGNLFFDQIQVKWIEKYAA